jgi:2-polyprenyl-3-methyl-5-hydroxy-6-metoxy-1,4-benzoquinol methylase
MRNYDESYFTLNKINFFRRTQIKEMAKLIRSIRKEGKLLEIGCGDGTLLGVLSKTFDVTGVDISSAAICKAKKCVDESRLRILDIEKESLEGQYDVILCLNVLEHLKQSDNAILKIKQSLRKGGVFIFSVPNNYAFGRIATLIMGMFDRTHVSALKRREWIKLISKSGLKPVKILNGVIYKPFNWEFGKYFASTMVMIVEVSEQPDSGALKSN